MSFSVSTTVVYIDQASTVCQWDRGATIEVRTRKQNGTAGTCSRPVVGGAEEKLVMSVQYVQ